MLLDNDSKYIINVDTHVITCENPTPVGQFDHLTEVKTFVCPKSIEGCDINDFNIKRVLFVNGSNKGIYEINDIHELGDGNVEFTWTISSQGTQSAGKLFFTIEFRKTDDDGTLLRSWQSSIFEGQKVLPGYDFDIGAIEAYIDILEQWKHNLMNYPIIQNGTWWIWDSTNNKYMDTHYTADGAKESKDAAAKSAEEAAESVRKVQSILDVLPEDAQELLDKVASSIYADDEGYLCLDKEILNG